MVASAASLWACSPAYQRSPQTNPVLADLVDYRNGLTLLREGRADEAIVMLKRCRLANPSDPAVINAMGLALLYKKDHAGANKAFAEALKVDPGFMEARNNRGVSLMDEGKLDEAGKDFEAVLDGSAPAEKVNARFNLGLLATKQKRWDDAERHFSLVLIDDSKYLRAFRERGLVRMAREDFRGALEDLLRFLKDDPTDPIANYNAALCLLTTGRRDLAIRYMERALEAAPESDEGQRAHRFLDAERNRGASAEEVR